MLELIASALASAALAATAPAETPRQLFEVVSRVEVDARGAIVAIEPPATTTPAISAAIDENIRKLHFTPPKLDGRPVSGATWVRMRVCSAPDGNDHPVAMRYYGHGPYPIKFIAPVIPRSAQLAGAGVGTTFDVELELLPDGSARLVKAKPLENKGYLREFLKSVRLWAESQRYHTDEVAGERVGDRFHVYLTYGGRPQSDVDAAEAEAKRIHDGCEAILAGRTETVPPPGGKAQPSASALVPESRVGVRP